MKDLISIIVPIYNTSKYLKYIFDTIENQLYKNFEVLLIDDGSTDNTKEICLNICSKDDRFHYYHQENKGVSAARNYGISLSSGNYIWFLDSDDYASYDFLSTSLYCYQVWDNILTMSESIVTSNHNRIGIKKFKYKLNYFYNNKNKVPALLGRLLFNSKIIKDNNIRFYPCRHFEDKMFITEYLEKSKSEFLCKTSAVFYRYLRDDSLCHDFELNNLKNPKNRFIEALPSLRNLEKKSKEENWNIYLSRWISQEILNISEDCQADRVY